MIHNLGLDPTKFRKVHTTISFPVMDFTPLPSDEAKFFISGTGMIGWLAVTGPPDLRYCHSRILQHLATPTRGALANLLHAARYCVWTHQRTAAAVPSLFVASPFRPLFRSFCRHLFSSHKWSKTLQNESPKGIKNQSKLKSQALRKPYQMTCQMEPKNHKQITKLGRQQID